MSDPAISYRNSQNPATTQLVSEVTVLLPDAEILATKPPVILDRLWDRHDLALVFCKHSDTIKRWERSGWIKAERKPSGRIIGYPAAQIVSVATRLFLRFPNATYDEIQAERVELNEILGWVRDTVSVCNEGNIGKAPPLLDALNLAALAGDQGLIPCLLYTSPSPRDRG